MIISHAPGLTIGGVLIWAFFSLNKNPTKVGIQMTANNVGPLHRPPPLTILKLKEYLPRVPTLKNPFPVFNDGRRDPRMAIQ